MKHSYSVFRRKSLRTITIVTGSMAVAFIVGVQTAGDVHPVISPTQADTTIVRGDFNGNGRLDNEDARIALQIASGYRSPTPAELAADPNQDFSITADDAMLILEELERTPQTPQVNL